MKKDRQYELWMIAIWGIAGLGIGLLAMATLVHWRPFFSVSAVPPLAHLTVNEAVQDDEALQSALTELRAGRLPPVAQAKAPWVGLWQALAQLQNDRVQALANFEDQVRQASPGPWLQADKLIMPEGRQTLEARLSQLDQALNAWTRRESDIQSTYDDALSAWFQQAPSWLDSDTRQTMVEAGSDAARSLYDYVTLEQSLLTQIRHLSQHIGSLGSKVKLSAPSGAAGAELVFVQRADFNRYQSSVTRLSELAAQEQAQMSKIRQVGKLHLKRLADAFLTVPPSAPVP